MKTESCQPMARPCWRRWTGNWPDRTARAPPPASLRRVPTQWVDAQAGIEAFIGWAQALIEAGVLAAADGRPRIEAAAALGALLPSAGGTDPEISLARKGVE